jgi:hypothetical protein
MRQTSIFIAAILLALLSGIAGAVAVVKAEHHWYTARGPVNLLDYRAVDLALADPSLMATMSWGPYTLAGIYWAILLTAGLAVGTFILVLLLGHSIRRATRNELEIA